MPATTLSRVYNTFLTLTHDAMRKRYADQIHKGTRLWDYLETYGRRADEGGFRYEDGGALIRVPVVWRKNQTAGSLRGFDPLDVTPQDPITAAFEDWSEVADAVTISRRDLRLNSGPKGWMKILDQQSRIAMDSLREECNREVVQGTIGAQLANVFGQGNDGKDMIPLPMLIGHNGTVGGTNAAAAPGRSLHGINPEVETWWKNQFEVGDGAMNFAKLRKLMQRLYNKCKRGSSMSAPDLILADQFSWECYERSQYGNQRFPGFGADKDTNSPGIGDDYIKYRNAWVTWDEFVPDVYTPNLDPDVSGLGTMFFINSEWFSLVVDTDSHFVTSPFRQPHNQLAIYSNIVLMAQMTVEQRRKQGILDRIQHTIDS